MSHNSFGKIFKFTTWGESHGPSIGVVIDGVPPLLELDEKDFHEDLSKRAPGRTEFVSQRKEKDHIIILSGVFNGLTTGATISLMIKNMDFRTKDYEYLQDVYRPGHADFTYQQKYGIRDHYGGGRSSARETAMRVAAGVVAKKILGKKVQVKGAVIRIGEIEIDKNSWDWEQVDKNPFFCPDSNTVKKWSDYLKNIRKNKDSVGAIIELQATGVPVGLGEPVYGKLSSDLAAALMSINAVKGVEIGSGFKSGYLKGSENSDEISLDENRNPKFLSNNAGGILGGISNGDTIVVRFAVKPTSSILSKLKTISKSGEKAEVSTRGRHDPCVGIRAVPIGEAMMYCVLADHLIRHRGQCASH